MSKKTETLKAREGGSVTVDKSGKEKSRIEPTKSEAVKEQSNVKEA